MSHGTEELRLPAEDKSTNGLPLAHTNALLAVGLTERFNECSLLASGACKAVRERLANEGSPTELILMEEAPYRSSFTAAPLSGDLELESGHCISLAIAKKAGEESSPSYLFAIARGDLAFPLASFSRRISSEQCDYVQIGREMTDESFIVTPADETKSRMHIIEAIHGLVTARPLPLRESPDEVAECYEKVTFRDLLKTLNASPDGKGQKRELAALIEVASEYGIIDDYQLSQSGRFLKDSAGSERKMSRELDNVRRVIGQAIKSRQAADFQLISRGMYYQIQTASTLINTYKKLNANKPEASVLIGLLDLNELISGKLGSTNTDYEKLLSHEKLIKYAGGLLVGRHPAVPFRGAFTKVEFQIAVNQLDDHKGYVLDLAVRPESMDEQEMMPIQTIEATKTTPPNSMALNSAADLLDLLDRTQ